MDPTDSASHADVRAASGTLRILQHLAAQRGPLPASLIANHLQLPRSTTYRLLGVLVDHGFVIHFAEARRYGVGIAAFELSSGFSRQEPLARLGRPILAALVDRLGESAHLAVLHGRDVLYLIEERARRRPALVTDVGVRLPGHLTASGLAMLAVLPPAQLRALYPDRSAFIPRGAPSAVDSYSALRSVLQDTRDRGYAQEDGEITPGMSSVAVAVVDHAGWPAAAIAATFARDSVRADKWPELASVIRFHSDELQRRISGPARPSIPSPDADLA